jgi:hypothetical protein
MTRYVVWRPDYEQTREDGKVIEAHSPSAACEKWAEREDADSADYLIVRGNSAELMVAELGSSLPPFRYSVSGETVPSYRATMLHGKPLVPRHEPPNVRAKQQ